LSISTPYLLSVFWKVRHGNCFLPFLLGNQTPLSPGQGHIE
jgi:hypothetical protein